MATALASVAGTPRAAVTLPLLSTRSQARLALVHSDWAAARECVTEAKALNESGGDWDRRNRLKVYEAVVALVQRGAIGGAAAAASSRLGVQVDVGAAER